MSYENDLLLRTLRKEEVERPPVWIMRQAGRILPEYRKIRASLSGFKELVQTPEMASTVTVQPINALDVDAAIIFSDILVIPECMGLEYELIEKKGPFFPKTIKTQEDIDRLGSGKESAVKLQYVFDALQLTKKKLDNRVPLIGFSGAPWTLMCYMIEGQGSKTFFQSKAMLYKDPEMAHSLLAKLTDTIIAYLKLKVEAGADVLQIFDSWAGVLNKELYAEFCMPYLQKIRNAIHEVPLIFFSKGAYFSLEELAALGADALGCDWTLNIDEVRRHTGPDQVLQGNMDPCALYADKKVISAHIKDTVAKMGKRHIFNLGHGVYPTTPKENVQFMVSEIKSLRY